MVYKFISDSYEGINYILEFKSKGDINGEDWTLICYEVLREYYQNKLKKDLIVDNYIDYEPSFEDLVTLFKNRGFELYSPDSINFKINLHEAIYNKNENLGDLPDKIEKFNKVCEMEMLNEMDDKPCKEDTTKPWW